MRRQTIGFAIAALLASAPLSAQWLQYRDPAVPRTKDGKANLTAPAPRTRDGRPDLSGVWMHDPTPMSELRRLFGPIVDEAEKNELPGMEIRNVHKYAGNMLVDFTPEDSPARPETIKAFTERIANRNDAANCASFGPPPLFPLPGLLSEPIKIVQAPRETLVLYEAWNAFRQIYADSRTLPTAFDLPSYFGYSVGRWDGDTFVVDSAGFNDKTTLDSLGHPHSDRLHIVERFRRRDFGHLDTEMTYDDPKMYTRPFTIKISYHLLADQDIFEMFSENEKDCAHIGKK